MIRFRCPNCSQTITAPDDHAGQAGRCPRCKGRIAVPGPPRPETRSHHLREGDANDITVGATHRGHPGRDDATHDNSQPGQARWPAPTAVFDSQASPQHAGQRQHPWPLDILLYATSASGLGNLAVIVGVPSFLMIVRRLFTPANVIQGDVFGFGQLLIGLYAVWYLAECAFDSARGGTRAPATSAQKANWRAMLLRVVYLGAVGLLLFLPAELYFGYAHQTDAVFWGLAGSAGILFPMALLAMVMLEAGNVLNPLFLLVAIVRTLPQYVLLLALFAAAALGQQHLFRGLLHWTQPIWLKVIGYAIAVYGAFILAHLLGRFYWRNRRRLDWGA